MRRIVFMRFGQPIPIPQVSEALRPHIANQATAYAFPMPGGVLSIFDTESTDEQITSDVKQVGAFFMVFPFNGRATNLPEPIMERLGCSTNDTDSQPVALTVDQILEKIYAGQSVESLTPEERVILERGV